MKKVLVIGLGVSGKSAVAYLLDKGALVTGVDRSYEVVNSVESQKLKDLGAVIVHEEDISSITAFDTIVVSPGVPRSHPLYCAAIKGGIRVIGEVELACSDLQQPFLAVTGTNGKTTVSLLITHILNGAGIPARALGNVGIPITSEVRKLSHEVIVAELSSFQLETLKTPVVDAGVILNITSDHLDRYEGIDEYAQAKINLQNCLKEDAPLFVEQNCYKQYLHLFKDKQPKFYGYNTDCDVYTDLEKIFIKEKIEYILPSGYKHRVSHDLENLMAAFAICSYMGVSQELFSKGVESFRKPEHRIEYVGHVGDVAYYNDSKGTNVDAVIRAVESMQGLVVLIAGGVDKGGSYSHWLAPFVGRVRAVVTIGQAAEKIERELGATMKVLRETTLQEAVESASHLAQPGDNVLLSPGCSSFDMFSNYEHRGEEFKRIVRAIPVESGG